MLFLWDRVRRTFCVRINYTYMASVPAYARTCIYMYMMSTNRKLWHLRKSRNRKLWPLKWRPTKRKSRLRTWILPSEGANSPLYTKDRPSS